MRVLGFWEVLGVETENKATGLCSFCLFLGFAATDFNAAAFLGFGLRINWVDKLAAVSVTEDELGV